MQADTHLDDINRVALKLLDYDFVKNDVVKAPFQFKPHGGKSLGKTRMNFLDKNSPYYNKNVKGMKTGTRASSYSIVALYEEDGKTYLITCFSRTVKRRKI